MLPGELEPAELLVTVSILVTQVLNCPGMHGLHYLEKGAVVRQARCCERPHMLRAPGLFPRPSPGQGACNIPKMEDQERWLAGIFSRLKEKALGYVVDVLNSPAMHRTILRMN